jgi:arginine-tRNA-protein transferase
MTLDKRTVRVFASQAHPCPYLPGKTDAAIFLDPAFPLDRGLFNDLIRSGFRRSGALVYRPHCPSCRACVSVRVPVQDFQPDRSQRRVWRANQDLRVSVRPAVFDEEHFALYLGYQAGRHPGSSMDDPDPDKYRALLHAPFADTVLCDMRVAGRLLAVAVADRLHDGISAVYTFYDPAQGRRGLGTYAILWLISHARDLGLEWAYLGYWIEGSRTMSYKIRFTPIEGYIEGRWQRLRPAAA